MENLTYEKCSASNLKLLIIVKPKMSYVNLENINVWPTLMLMLSVLFFVKILD